MRLIPILTAILVTTALYFAVLEREALLAFARADDAATAAEETPEQAAADESGPTTVGVTVLRSQARTIDSAVVVRGQTRANREVHVRAETSATVISDPLRKGAFVEEGQILCRLNPGTREARLAEAEARLEEAEGRVPEAEARLQEAHARLEEALINDNAAAKLSEGGYASSTRVAAAQAGVRAAEAGIASAQSYLKTAQSGIKSAAAAVASAEREIDHLTITAPFGGLLESDTAELGSLMQPGGLCATVIQLDPIKLVGFVPESEIDRVTMGTMAGGQLASGRQVIGEVTFISRSADLTTRTFEVEITVPNGDLSIRDGQTVDIAISSDGALAHKLPQSSLTLNNEGRLGVRIVDENDIVDFKPVTMLRDQSDGVWVSGLPEQADVIVIGQEFVVAGVKVAPTYREAAQ